MAGLDYVNMSGKAGAAFADIEKRQLRDEIKPLVTKEIIEEHKKNPIGFHSKNLLRVLYQLRRHHLAMPGTHVIVCTKPHKEWCIGEISDMRGLPVKIHRDKCFSSRLEAEHGVFLERLKVLDLL